jgi:predicted nucleic acid-binding protein
VIVLDCSYAMAMVLPDASRPASAAKMATTRLIAPAIWPDEVANALRNALRRGRLLDEDVPHICARLAVYEVEVLANPDAAVLPRYRAAHTHGLTPYDASYLELAASRRCALATLDTQLAAAARNAGVLLLD